MGSLDRFLKFIDILDNRNKCTVREIAQELEVSIRTVQRYKLLALDHGYIIDIKLGRYGYYQLIKMLFIINQNKLLFF